MAMKHIGSIIRSIPEVYAMHQLCDNLGTTYECFEGKPWRDYFQIRVEGSWFYEKYNTTTGVRVHVHSSVK